MPNIVLAVALGIVTLLTAYLGVHLTLHPAESALARRMYKIAFIACGFLSVVLIGWQAKRNVEGQQELSQSLKRIEGNGVKLVEQAKGPIKVEVLAKEPKKIPERAHFHILSFELLRMEDTTIGVNVFVQNTGKASASMQVYEVTAFGKPDDSRRNQLEADIRKSLDDAAKEGKDATKTLPAGTSFWFTHQMLKLGPEQVEGFNNGTLQYVFAGELVYKDKVGTQKTYYCASNSGKPKVFVFCAQNNEEP